MENDELNHLIKSASVPQRDQTYWEEFPRTVSQAIKRSGASTVIAPQSKRQTWFSPAFIGGLATACIVFAFCIGFWKGRDSSPAVDQLAAIQKYFREIEALFPNQLQAIIFDENGSRLVLSENADVPRSTPVFLTISDEKSSRRIVTFSGQQISIQNQVYEVLTDNEGNILLVGEKSVWASNEANQRMPYKVQAVALKTL